ncbi:hypothetical protein [Paenibacillus sp. LjRoot153]|uniref:hypothetical protein n=1 Tax=Paenibacillus sp. LjRoot153 TaxID=3342270 RepID=UPI003F4FF791
MRDNTILWRDVTICLGVSPKSIGTITTFRQVPVFVKRWREVEQVTVAFHMVEKERNAIAEV